jgi:hypothetical protein
MDQIDPARDPLRSLAEAALARQETAQRQRADDQAAVDRDQAEAADEGPDPRRGPTAGRRGVRGRGCRACSALDARNSAMTAAWTTRWLPDRGRGKRSQPPRQRAVKPACPWATTARLHQQPSRGQPEGNTVTGPDPGPEQSREGYRQLLAPVPSGTRTVEELPPVAAGRRRAATRLPYVRVVAVDPWRSRLVVGSDAGR